MKGRDRGGFAHAYDENVWRVYGFFGYRLGSRLDAEDLTQHTFERALRAWDRFDAERGSQETWLLAIARNLLIDHYRGNRSSSERPLSEDPETVAALGHTPPPEDAIGLEPELEAALNTLDERARELLALRFGGDLNGPEIAELTGLSVANVQQILSRSLRRLRAELEQAGSSYVQPAPNGPAPAMPRATTASSRPPEPA